MLSEDREDTLSVFSNLCIFQNRIGDRKYIQWTLSSSYSCGNFESVTQEAEFLKQCIQNHFQVIKNSLLEIYFVVNSPYWAILGYFSKISFIQRSFNIYTLFLKIRLWNPFSYRILWQTLPRYSTVWRTLWSFHLRKSNWDFMQMTITMSGAK